MAQQNIFDDEVFFAGYQRLRAAPGNANDLFEIPALFSLLPDLRDKDVLDLGCGGGEHCREYARRGARQVVGIDISEKMLAVARAANAAPCVTYRRLPLEELAQLAGQFDVVTSSLAFHYVADFAGLLANVHALLKAGGLLIFSQEHPLCTCHAGGDRWTKDASGHKLHLNLADYGVEGERVVSWLVDGVQKYHRTFSTIVNDLVAAGFAIEKMLEPLPTAALLEKWPQHADLRHKPDFLLVRARKA